MPHKGSLQSVGIVVGPACRAANFKARLIWRRKSDNKKELPLTLRWSIPAPRQQLHAAIVQPPLLGNAHHHVVRRDHEVVSWYGGHRLVALLGKPLTGLCCRYRRGRCSNYWRRRPAFEGILRANLREQTSAPMRDGTGIATRRSAPVRLVGFRTHRNGDVHASALLEICRYRLPKIESGRHKKPQRL